MGLAITFGIIAIICAGIAWGPWAALGVFLALMIIWAVAQYQGWLDPGLPGGAGGGTDTNDPDDEPDGGSGDEPSGGGPIVT